MRLHPLTCLVATLLAASTGAGQDADTLASKLGKLDPSILKTDPGKAKEHGQMLTDDAKARMQAANLRENKAWQAVNSKVDWERYRDERIAALRRSLGDLPPAPKSVAVRVTGKIEGEGYRIENLLFESRPGLWVTANLYSPTTAASSMPGILLAHSQHNPKTQSELQDMGILWARQGCLVLVPDMLGHGERRQHPFIDAQSYPSKFAVGRQDYYFRYNTALQLHVVGESLAGWMAWDLMRGVDVLLANPGIDKNRVLLFGSVAGGGDPAAVAAALDTRIAAVAPFSFGGPQPDYAIPENTDRDFYWFGVPTWESTRCLRLGARGGFSHWLIASAVAPRGLIYSHEFGWEEKTDPAWPRMQKVFGFYGKSDRLAVAAGKGNLRGRPPEHTHCNNIGAIHRSKMYPTLKSWFGFPIPEKENDQRRESKELLCLTAEIAMEIKAKQVHELAAQIGEDRVTVARGRLAKLDPQGRRKQLRDEWTRLLGDVTPKAGIPMRSLAKEKFGETTVERLVLEVESRVQVPMLLLRPPGKATAPQPVVIAFAQDGKEKFLTLRAQAIAELLQSGVAVCLPDLRGTGETQVPGARTWRSGATAVSQHELMLGQTLLGSRLRDLRAVIAYLKTRPELAPEVTLWGDSFAALNAPDRNLKMPLDADKLPAHAEPVGGLLALLGGLYDDSVGAIYARGGLSSYQSLLDSQFVYVPHDAVVPGALTAGDLCDVAAALAPRQLRLEGLVDGLNRPVAGADLTKAYEPTQTAYRSVQAAGNLEINSGAVNVTASTLWLKKQASSK